MIYSGEKEQTPLMIYRNGETKKEIEVRKEDPYYLELKYFLDCVENNKLVEKGSPEQAILALVARDSAEKGEMVKFSRQ
ncbi:MAG TPA: hypothetical protein PK016_04125 [Candidatus Atribacteria bacterium]|nr:hypothetical protein [Candidatus Atribacteria bacterium]